MNWPSSPSGQKTVFSFSGAGLSRGIGYCLRLPPWVGLFLLGVILASPAALQAQQPSVPPTGGNPACTGRESWIFQPSRFSHLPGDEQRLVQYQTPPPAVAPSDPTYQESGYRHKRSGLAVRGSFDYRHVVETWGAGESIRPYGEWLYPFRPGATPFGPWGNPQGPWTLPFQSWQNPYGSWNRYGYPYGMVPWLVWPPGAAPPPP